MFATQKRFIPEGARPSVPLDVDTATSFLVAEPLVDDDDAEGVDADFSFQQSSEHSGDEEDEEEGEEDQLPKHKTEFRCGDASFSPLCFRVRLSLTGFVVSARIAPRFGLDSKLSSFPLYAECDPSQQIETYALDPSDPSFDADNAWIAMRQKEMEDEYNRKLAALKEEAMDEEESCEDGDYEGGEVSLASTTEDGC